ncbi:MAG: hypothetical protein HN736_07040 [Anaerolineae bacterium]|jgi:YbbR domain-containing protein|nr:hypothetical protein [Anaerolineae bacterium]MBT4311364.1 hypothetical protein [Anaerolineae bacterium]MBT4459578.1 hypothetical protein [Anaerolineae bacterium]MBT4841665.1 hypothetical protein [Anaerolineae bacterium]MBT6060152.1 hypothetical protein [Anaerolineae bacterium]
MFRWLGKNIGTFLLALVLSIGVWVAAVNASDPDEELIYPAPITLEVVGQDTDLLITNIHSEEIELTLRAPRSIWAQLTADESSIHAILDLSGLKAGQYSLEPQIQIGIQPTRIISFSPASITIILEELITRSFPIQLNLVGEPSVGYQAGLPKINVDEVIISGPKSLVERVESVRTSFNLDESRENISENLSLEAVDENNQIMRGVNLNPEEIELEIPISQQGGYRDVAVKVTVTGQVANLYRLTNISVFPPVLTIYSADTQLVNDLPGVIETEPLDINGINEDSSTRLKPVLPENILIVGDQSVLVEVSVEAILGSLTISEKPLEIINLDPALAAELSSETVDIIISGPLSELDTLSANDLRAVIDVEGLTNGSHQLTPLIEILNNAIKVESVLPESIEITLSDAPPVTPTAEP